MPHTDPILLFPGFAATPAYYRPLIDALSSAIGAVTEVYCPPGVASRVDESCAPEIDLLVADVSSRHPGQFPVLIGHSWGCHLARCLALRTSPTLLVEIDPQLVRPPSSTTFDAPRRVANRKTLVELYASYGVAEPDIRWDWWEEDADGSYGLVFNPDQLSRYLQAQLDSYPDRVWPSLGGVSVVVLRTTAESLTQEQHLASLCARFANVRFINVAGARHRLGPDDQRAIAAAIALLF